MLRSTDTKELLSRYWQEFNHYLMVESAKLPKSKNAHNTWCNFALGTSLGTLEAVANTIGSNRVELRIHGKRATETYDKLKMLHEDHFSQQVHEVIWDEMPKCILKRVYVEQSANIHAHEDWVKQFAWLKTNLEVFYSFFQPKLKNIHH